MSIRQASFQLAGIVPQRNLIPNVCNMPELETNTKSRNKEDANREEGPEIEMASGFDEVHETDTIDPRSNALSQNEKSRVFALTSHLNKVERGNNDSRYKPCS